MFAFNVSLSVAHSTNRRAIVTDRKSILFILSRDAMVLERGDYVFVYQKQVLRQGQVITSHGYCGV